MEGGAGVCVCWGRGNKIRERKRGREEVICYGVFDDDDKGSVNSFMKRIYGRGIITAR